MKIGSKIALFYTVITVGAIALIVLVFYLFTLRYIKRCMIRIFRKRLI